MTLIELDDVGTEPISLQEAKAWCRIDRNDEDDLIEALIRAAREAVERQTRLALVRRRFRFILSELPENRRVTALRRPLVAVTAITAYGSGGSSRSLPPGEAVVERFGTSEALRFSEMAATLGAEGIAVDVTAGFAEGAVPEELRLAMKRIVAASYEMRVPGVRHPSAGSVPPAIGDVIAAYREVRL